MAAAALPLAASAANDTVKSVMDFLNHSGGIGISRVVKHKSKNTETITTYSLEVKGWELGLILLALGTVYLSEIATGNFITFEDWLLNLGKKIGNEANPSNWISWLQNAANSWGNTLEKDVTNSFHI